MQEDIEIRQIVKFSGEGYGKASVTFRVGPIVVHGARIMEKNGKRWLSYPSRPGGEGKWFHVVACESQELTRELERLAFEAYDRTALAEDAAVRTS